MTERQKQIAIGLVVLVVALFLLLKRGSVINNQGNSTVNYGGANFGGVDIPRSTFSIPDLSSGDWFKSSGTCCMDCAGASGPDFYIIADPNKALN